MATANKIDEWYDENNVDGFLQYTVTQLFEVLTENRNDPPSAAMAATGLPPIGQQAIVAGTNVSVWCTKRSPRRREASNKGALFRVTCTFTNFTQEFERDAQGNPVTDPTQAVKRVDISYLEYAEPIADASLKRFTKGGPDWSDNASDIALPPWLAPSQSSAGAILLSNGSPVLLERTAYRKIIAVSQVYRNWDNTWDSYIDAINTDSVTISEVDADGQRWSQTFDPYTLRCKPPQKENIWKEQKLFYRRTITVEYNPNTWIHAELDADTKQRIYVGQYKGGTGDGQYTQSDLNKLGIKGDFGIVEKTTKDKANGPDSTLSNPAKLNGNGMLMPTIQPDNYDPDTEIYGNWYINTLKEFAPLNL